LILVYFLNVFDCIKLNTLFVRFGLSGLMILVNITKGVYD